jgi:hypothetical protein
LLSGCWIISAVTARLLGDLVEQYARGQSRTWFWRQTVTAAFVCSLRDVREHKRLTLTAVLMGSGLMFIGTAVLGEPLSRIIRSWMLYRVIPAWMESAFPPPAALPFFGLWVLDLTSYAPLAAVGTASGWVVGRLYRQHGVFMLVFATAVLVRALVHSVEAMAPTMAVSRTVFLLTWTLLPTCSVVFGGVWGLGRDERPCQIERFRGTGFPSRSAYAQRSIGFFALAQKRRRQGTRASNSRARLLNCSSLVSFSAKRRASSIRDKLK